MRFVLWGLMFFSFAAKASDVPDTDLGSAGNLWVAQTFQQYQANALGCRSSGGPERRILVQGFGPFSGIARNLSGAVVAHLAGLPDVPQTQHGGWTATRKLTVEGESLEFCFVYLDVIWDLAGAILLTEIERFNPELVMMSGVGSFTTIVEGGAQNGALGLSGFDAQGNPIKAHNTPWCGDRPCGYAEQTHVLSPKAPGVEATVTHSWDNVSFARTLLESVKLFAPQMIVEAPKAARNGNDYLCNNVSYIVQSALNGAEIKLAGGLIAIPAKRSDRAAGFLHYQADSDPSPKRIQEWAAAVARALKRH